MSIMKSESNSCGDFTAKGQMICVTQEASAMRLIIPLAGQDDLAEAFAAMVDKWMNSEAVVQAVKALEKGASP